MIVINRHQAEERLRMQFGLHHFYDEQWLGISALLKEERVLMIQKTGFGKSLVFQFTATQLPGLSIVFSPLIALMRDQVNSLNKLGIDAAVINSTLSDEEKESTLARAKEGKYKLLYIAPERQEDSTWLEAVRSMNISMIVVDEAHCISTWGHDFRPSYRRIINLIQLLPGKFPVLACTATATTAVQADIENQLGSNLLVLRGKLLRDNFKLSVVLLDSQEAKLETIAKLLDRTIGSGVVYCGTQVETEIYTRWCEFLKIHVANYHAGLDNVSRKKVEEGLMNNNYKAVFATNALGMGIDKPDIRFIIHTQIPTSPLHYYQEIGRAGRDGKPAQIVLLYQDKIDDELPLSFIKGGRPAEEFYKIVMHELQQEPLSLYEIIKRVNLKRTAVTVILNDLVDQKIISKAVYGRRKIYEYRFDAPDLDSTIFTSLREHKLAEFEQMKSYVYTKDCRMKFLCTYLGDLTDDECGSCDIDKGKQYSKTTDKAWLGKIQEFRESYFPILKVETRKGTLKNGVASSYYGVSQVGKMIHRSKYEDGGDFPDYLLKLTLKAYRKHFGRQRFDLVVFIPPTESGDLVKNFAEKISKTLGFIFSDGLVKARQTEPQKIFESAISKKENVCGAFDLKGISVKGMSVLIIDDIFDSGHTIKAAAKLLQNNGAQIVAPLVIAKTIGGR